MHIALVSTLLNGRGGNSLLRILLRMVRHDVGASLNCKKIVELKLTLLTLSPDVVGKVNGRF